MKEQYSEISTDILISKALSSLEENEDEYWNYIRSLHTRGSREVFQAASDFCNSYSTREIITGVDILAQLGVPDRSFPEEALKMLHNLVRQKDQDSQVLNSALVAIGHTQEADNKYGLSQVIVVSNNKLQNTALK